MTWFLIYFFVDGKSRRYFCKGSGAWRQAGTCGSYTFQKVGETEHADKVVCTQGHQTEVAKGYSTERNQIDGGLF
jgi:hypothetical protein